jgi:hypothetical protein
MDGKIRRRTTVSTNNWDFPPYASQPSKTIEKPIPKIFLGRRHHDNGARCRDGSSALHVIDARNFP